MSRATTFFDEIKAGSTPFLRNLVATRKQELDYLDFKGGAHLKDKDVKQAWSQALSGFANTEGGVLVWGIRAVRNPTTKIDEAATLDPVPDTGSFAQMLRDVELQAVIDPVPGVQIECYPDSSTAGFVVCLIPEGPHKPYRAELHEKQYYQRIGDKFVVIPHSLLRCLFYPPVPRPKFRVTIEQTEQIPVLSEDARSARAGNRFEVVIQNVDRASARDVWVTLKVDHPFRSEAILCVRALNEPNEVGYHLTRPLHPGEQFKFTNGIVQYPGSDLPGETTSPKQISYEICVYATDCEPVSEQLIFTELSTASVKTTDFSSTDRV